MRTPILWGFALIAVLFPCAVAPAQTITKLAPLPNGADLSGVSFTSPTVGWVAGALHTLLKTTDHGVTWKPIALPGYASEPLYDVNFVNSQLGFVTGNSSETWNDNYRTTDGGTTWQQITNFPFGSWYHADFVSATTGFIGANGALLRTTDGGVNFSLRSAYPDCPMIYGMRFLDASTGIVCGYQASSNQSGIFKTTDGGKTWALKYAANSNDAVYLSNTVLISADSYQILRSTNGGENWSPISNISTGFSSLARVDANTVVGVSTGGDIWRSTDGGFTWSRRVQGVGDLPEIWRVRFLDNLNGHVVGQGGAIYETPDGGATWTVLNRGISRDWNGIVAFSDSQVLMAGFHGYVQSTADSGEHWGTRLLDPPSFGRDTSFSDVAILDTQTALVVGHWGSMFKTSDQGATWVNLSDRVNPSYYANGVAFTDANNGWMVGWDYNTGPKSYVRRTRDGGNSWQTADAVNFPGMDVAFVGQNGWIIAGGTGLYRTSDGGTTWSTVILPLSEGVAPSTMSTAWGTDKVGYICGFDRYLVRSTDSGVTWKKIEPTDVGFVYLGVIASGSSEVWVCGARQGGGNAIVKRSLDGGATWQTWSLPGQYTTPYIMVRTPSHVYVTGYAGDTWRFDVGGTSIPDLSALSLLPTSVVGGKTSIGTVTISAPAPSGGTVVEFSSSITAASVPASVTIPSGATSATFTVTTSPVTVKTTSTISATLGAITKSATLTINRPSLKSVKFTPSTVVGGVGSAGTVALTGPAPAGGIAVTLSSSAGQVTVPASVTIPAGSESVTFTAATTVVTSSVTVAVSAQSGTQIRKGTLTVVPLLKAVKVSPLTVVGGMPTKGSVVLYAPAPAGGLTVSLSTTNSAATVPASVLVPAGATTTAFTVKTSVVTVNTTGTISGVALGATKTSGILTITP